MSELTIIEVSGVNLSAVENLALDIWREHFNPIIGRPQVDYMLEKFQSAAAIRDQIENQGFLYYLFEDEKERYIGYCAVVPRPDELFLSKLYFNAENRRRGFGRRALEFIESIARDKRLSKITLTVNKNNTGPINAYKKLGFVITDSLVTDIGSGFVMDDYKMTKCL